MEDDNGYAGGDSSSDNESTSSSPRNGPFGDEGTDDGNVRLEHELGVDHEQADPADLDYMSDSMMGSGDEYEYIGDSDIDMGHEEDPEESEVITGSYSGSTSELQDHLQDEEAGDCNFNMNIELDEDRRGRYRQIMEMFLYSKDAAYSFYNKYAKENGFSIRRDKVKQTKNAPGQVGLRHFVSSREGKRHKRYFANLGGRSQRLRAESRCNCKVHLVVKLDRRRGVWVVARFDDLHNHILAKADEVPFLWSQRKIKDFQKAEILALGAAGVRKHMIMSSFISKYGRYNEVGFVRWDVYNMCAREKRKLIANGDASTSLGIMLSRRDNDPDFFFEYQADEMGRLRSMFWCDSQSRQDYQDFGDVVVFDSTYKMNRYGMPFIPFVGLNNHCKITVFGCAIVLDETEETYIWLLQTFLRAMCQKKPKTVITDGDASMIRAIGAVLIGVWHRLCSWHREKHEEAP
ncbi:protein FAR1-RELATED SEQUENCE 5-like [Brachypodium distachyon]|uniref:protein FAR1-RELATED SEQUENCE 5-like n=1 Tax=Brachypodium distachyon TaxID=15368 RepID=UPI000530097A|nr:protein FAR1-RELATED SEQUENCE 5-like [Brachypodium distachyon]|eukprot:XP_010240740.1 protein FAR1-RELATED SEQUENCE 5-like [Brachypodium distachyon]